MPGFCEATCNFYFDQVLAFTFIGVMPDISFIALGLFKWVCFAFGCQEVFNFVACYRKLCIKWCLEMFVTYQRLKIVSFLPVLMCVGWVGLRWVDVDGQNNL